jgi:hypothetical protein
MSPAEDIVDSQRQAVQEVLGRTISWKLARLLVPKENKCRGSIDARPQIQIDFYNDSTQ